MGNKNIVEQRRIIKILSAKYDEIALSLAHENFMENVSRIKDQTGGFKRNKNIVYIKQSYHSNEEFYDIEHNANSRTR